MDEQKLALALARFTDHGVKIAEGTVTTEFAIRFCAEIGSDADDTQALSRLSANSLRPIATVAADSILALIVKMPPPTCPKFDDDDDSTPLYSPKKEVYDWMPEVAQGLLAISIALVEATPYDPHLADSQYDEVSKLWLSLRNMYPMGEGPENMIARAALKNLNIYLEKADLDPTSVWVALESRFRLWPLIPSYSDPVVDQSAEFAEAMADLRWAHNERTNVIGFYEAAVARHAALRDTHEQWRHDMPPYDPEDHEHAVVKRNVARFLRAAAGQNMNPNVSPEGFGSPEFLGQTMQTLFHMVNGPYELPLLAERARVSYLASVKAVGDEFGYGMKAFPQPGLHTPFENLR